MHRYTGSKSTSRVSVVHTLQSLDKQLQQLDVSLEENTGRIGVMDEHLKNVQQEITYTESRVRGSKGGSSKRCLQLQNPKITRVGARNVAYMGLYGSCSGTMPANPGTQNCV